MKNIPDIQNKKLRRKWIFKKSFSKMIKVYTVFFGKHPVEYQQKYIKLETLWKEYQIRDKYREEKIYQNKECTVGRPVISQDIIFESFPQH